jgi:hypothetical protein
VNKKEKKFLYPDACRASGNGIFNGIAQMEGSFWLPMNPMHAESY